MREILFRAKRLDNGDWVEGYLTMRPSAIQIGDYSPWYISVPPLDPDDDGGYYNVDPATVGQYTGFKDKHGKRIFERDLVKPFYDGSDDLVVVFRDGEFQLCERLYKCRCGWALYSYGDDIEVVGNIYDN